MTRRLGLLSASLGLLAFPAICLAQDTELTIDGSVATHPATSGGTAGDVSMEIASGDPPTQGASLTPSEPIPEYNYPNLPAGTAGPGGPDLTGDATWTDAGLIEYDSVDLSAGATITVTGDHVIVHIKNGNPGDPAASLDEITLDLTGVNTLTIYVDGTINLNLIDYQGSAVLEIQAQGDVTVGVPSGEPLLFTALANGELNLNSVDGTSFDGVDVDDGAMTTGASGTDQVRILPILTE